MKGSQLLGFLGGAVAMAAISHVVPTLNAQGAAISGCIVPNTNLLRIAQACAAGEQHVSLMSSNAPPGTSKTPPPLPPNTTKVRAPFEIVDEQGRTIVRVTSGTTETRGLKLFNEQNQQVAVMNAIGDGGLVKVIKAGGDMEGVSMSTIEGPQLTLTHGSKQRAIVGRTPGGRIAFWVNNMQEKQIAALGDSPVAGAGGALRIYADGGKPAVSLDSPASGGMVNVYTGGGRLLPVAAIKGEMERGVVAVYNGAGNAAAALTESETFKGAGRIYVNDSSGGWAFSAGLTGTGGNACVNRNTGLWCVGVNVPMGIGASPK